LNRELLQSPRSFNRILHPYGMQLTRNNESYPNVFREPIAFSDSIAAKYGLFPMCQVVSLVRIPSNQMLGCNGFAKQRRNLFDTHSLLDFSPLSITPLAANIATLSHCTAAAIS